MRLLFLLLLTVQIVFAQSYNSNKPPNTYRSPGNPHYWKNKPPHAAYWQQDVYYRIEAELDDKTGIVDGKLNLTYWNNSPDTLTFAFFHLYQNAFQPGSYLHQLNKANQEKPEFGNYESGGLGTTVSDITINEQAVIAYIDNTIMKVTFPDPLPPGGSAEFSMNFKTYFDRGSLRRRMKKFNTNGSTHYDGVHWYPRITVYDNKFKWNTDQHLGKEFYGNFGAFDVKLTFASHYIADATGTLQNQNEMLPDSLRQMLDLKNFKDKPLGSPASILIPANGSKKTWHFYAENVHDFAWTADPTYRIGEAEWNGIKCIALAQETNASGWQNAAEYTAKIIEVFSRDFGMYEWPKIIVADARDGMEYPMLTLDGGTDPGYRQLLVHEVGHMWFFGMIGSNETYRAALDEGFTQFLTAWGLEAIDGKYEVRPAIKSGYIRKFHEPWDVRTSRVYYGYLNTALRQNELPLNTHSDDFNNALGHGGGYSMVYYKPATMLYNLQYVLGDSLFLLAMQHYVRQWKFCHPYFEDFRNSIIDYTKADLNWFFDQWLETTKTIDYAVNSFTQTRVENEFRIKFTRKGSMQMPLDFTIYARDGTMHEFHIPNTWYVKKTSATVLPKWTGWGKFNPEYEATVVIPSGIERVLIDTTHRLADIYMPDNSYPPVLRLKFDSQVASPPLWTQYELKGRPDFWWNAFDGVKAGFHINGNYMRYRDVFALSAWFNTGLGQRNFSTPVPVNDYDDFSFNFTYRNGINHILNDAYIDVKLRFLDGLKLGDLGFIKGYNDNKYQVFARVKSMIREEQSDLVYLLYPREWEVNRPNPIISLGGTKTYNFKSGSGVHKLMYRASGFASDFSFNFLSYTAVHYIAIGRLDLSTRLFGQYGYGKSIPSESALFLAGANPEEMMENKFTRSRGFVPDEWALNYRDRPNHFHHGGGLNLRGYAGYLVPEEVRQNLFFAYKGISGLSANVELDLDRLVAFRPTLTRNWLKLDVYLFGDAGTINYTSPTAQPRFIPIRADAGAGTALTIKKWGPLQTVKPLTLRFDMPFFLNRIPASENEYFKFRYIVGVNRSF